MYYHLSIKEGRLQTTLFRKLLSKKIIRSTTIKQYCCWDGVDEERTQNAVWVFLRLFCSDVIDPGPTIELLVAGGLVPPWCTLTGVGCIGTRCVGLLVGALPGIVPSLTTPKAGDLPWRVGLDPTVVRRFDYRLGLLLRLVILAEHRVLVPLLLKVGSCRC